jgi:hypothetical protein
MSPSIAAASSARAEGSGIADSTSKRLMVTPVVNSGETAVKGRAQNIRIVGHDADKWGRARGRCEAERDVLYLDGCSV